MKKLLLLTMYVLGMTHSAYGQQGTIINKANDESGDSWEWKNETPANDGTEYIICNSMQLKEPGVVRALKSNDSNNLATKVLDAGLFTLSGTNKIKIDGTEYTIETTTTDDGYSGYAIYKKVAFKNYVYCSGDAFKTSSSEKTYKNNYVWSFFSKSQKETYTDYCDVRNQLTTFDETTKEYVLKEEYKNNQDAQDFMNTMYYGSTDAERKATQKALNDIKAKVLGDLGYANIKVNAGKYGTFVAPFACDIPSGAKVYKVTGIDGSDIVLTAVTGTQIPAGMPVLVYSESAIDKTYEGTPTASTPNNSGMLKGTYADAQVTSGYVLQTVDGNQAFREIKNIYPTVRKNRCYLGTSTSSASLRFVLETAETAINAVSSSATSAYYTTYGAKLTAPQRGINIVKKADGTTKKILVK